MHFNISKVIFKMNNFCIGIQFVVGLIFLIGGSVFVGLFPEILRDKIDEKMPLINGSHSYKTWQRTKSPITMKFYFFHVNNSDTYTSLDDLELVERGPYVYDETRVKQNIKKVGNDLLSYKENITYTFMRNNYNDRDENEEINFVNFPVLGILQNRLLGSMSEQIFAMSYPDIETHANESGLIMKSKVVDLLFDGIPYNVFQYAELLGIPSSYTIMNGGKSRVEEERTVNTGKSNIKQLGQISSFDKKHLLTNGLDDSLIWPNYNTAEHNCSQIKGTDGRLFSTDISKGDTLYIFEPQLCRTVFIKYWRETEVRNINTYRFRVPEEYFYSPHKRTENSCYCLKDKFEKCNAIGMLDISNCYRKTFGAPVVMSAPYFHHGEESLRNQFKLQPKKKLNDKNYGTYLDIEPMTGLTLKAVRRLQMNIRVEKADYPTMPKLNQSSQEEYVIPIFWIEEVGELNEDQADDFKSRITNKIILAYSTSITGIVVGALMIFVSIYLLIRKR